MGCKEATGIVQCPGASNSGDLAILLPKGMGQASYWDPVRERHRETLSGKNQGPSTEGHGQFESSLQIDEPEEQIF